MKFWSLFALLVVLVMSFAANAQVEVSDDWDLLVEVSVSLAPAQVPGVYQPENVVRGLLCYDEVEAERLAQAADRNRRDQYRDRLNAPSPPCIDLRAYNLQLPISSEAVVERSFEIPVGRGCLRQTVHVQESWIEYWTVVCVTLPL